MLEPKDFVRKWGDDDVPLLQFPRMTVERLAMAPEDKAFLQQAGLPEDAAPFLAFDPPVDELPTVADEWPGAKGCERYRMIGADGEGNPIAIDEARAGEVVLLNHERQFARTLMNTSVRQLAASLLAYRTYVDGILAESEDEDDNALLESHGTPAARQALRAELTRIDPAAMQPTCFWHVELANLDAAAG